jgi:hypothetical protein
MPVLMGSLYDCGKMSTVAYCFVAVRDIIAISGVIYTMLLLLYRFRDLL